MIKKLLILIFVILLTACTNKETTLEKEKYDEYTQLLQKEISNSEYLPFDIDIYVDKIVETEVMYRVIIDNPKIALRDIETLVIHDKYTEDIFPSSGIFDTKYSLIPNLVNESSNYAKGIILIGYIPYEGDIKNLNATFKVIFKYKDDDLKDNTILYSTRK